MIYSNFRGGINSDKVKKAKIFRQNMAKGKEKFRQESLSKWTEEDHSNWNRLLRVKDIYTSIINKTIPKDQKAKIASILYSLQFVNNEIYNSCNEWGRPLSAKQLSCVVKAEEVINNNAELLI